MVGSQQGCVTQGICCGVAKGWLRHPVNVIAMPNRLNNNGRARLLPRWRRGGLAGALPRLPPGKSKTAAHERTIATTGFS